MVCWWTDEARVGDDSNRRSVERCVPRIAQAPQGYGKGAGHRYQKEGKPKSHYERCVNEHTFGILNRVWF